tara:strand:+ start:331 stop:675 length:345 start_codon:yes stop_codon:yes gene_type:complete
LLWEYFRRLFIPIIFWGIIILVVVHYHFYKKKHPNKDRVIFTGWRRIIYYLGFLNIFSLVFWFVVLLYYNKYNRVSKKLFYNKLAYVIYYFGYIIIIVALLWIIFGVFLYIPIS